MQVINRSIAVCQYIYDTTTTTTNNNNNNTNNTKY